MESLLQPLCIIGGGNLAQAIATGFTSVEQGYTPDQIIITRRRLHLLDALKDQGFQVQVDNRDAVRRSRLIILSVLPNQTEEVLQEIADVLDPAEHVLVSTVTGVEISDIERMIGKPLPLIRAMPNTAIAVGESMTCLSYNERAREYMNRVKAMFDWVGETMIIKEDLMVPATSLCACGIAFFLRSIRAASQGGIEIGFHSDEAIAMAVQTAKGAATLLQESGGHPEQEVDKVTSPRGCTIAGLNRMEHEGFSSAMIKGIVLSAEMAANLFTKKKS
jgi:pyrroline-5-carboxylate reductase